MIYRCPKTHKLLHAQAVLAGKPEGFCGRCSKRQKKECRDEIMATTPGLGEE